MKILLRAVSIMIALILMVGCKPSYDGDGVFTDSGILSHPRFHVTFESVGGDQSKNSYEIKSIPSAKYFMLLYWGGDDREARRAAEISGARVYVNIADKTGNVLCDFSEDLVDMNIASSVSSEAFWHDACRLFRMNSGEKYTISIELSIGQEYEGRFILRPVLEGGGTELP